MMSVLYIHLCWFFFMLLAFLFSLVASLSLSYLSSSLYISFSLFSLQSYPFVVSFYLDWISSWFMTSVLLISTIVAFYSYNYMAPYSKPRYFIVLTTLFVLSMLLVVTMSDLFFLMLGWDGLGVVSFFLIVYYQNQSSVTSGIFTLLINRVGDRFFLVSIGLISYYSQDYFSWGYGVNSIIVLFLVITFITKRAIYPFSPWLPIAMAAPTPISSLVHSSTLVTAGLYLMMRFSSYLYSSYSLIVALTVLRLYTSFYAGINTIFEIDLKKLIALSTLSHLGFIGIAFSSGLIHLAFFHILAHAFFKSLLFITIGDIIINLNHSQDIRYLSSGSIYTPVSCWIMYVSLFNLLGLPMLRGFYTKDFVLESINYSSSSFLILFVIFLNIIFTYYYTYQLFFYSFSSNKVLPFQSFHSLSILHTTLLLALGVLTLAFPTILLRVIYSRTFYLAVPPSFKFFPIVANFLTFLSLLLFLKQLGFKNKTLSLYFSSIMFLSPFIITVMSNFYYSGVFKVVKSFELGLLNYSLNGFLPSIVFTLSKWLVYMCYPSPLRIVLFSFPLVLILFMFLLSNINNYIWLLLIKFHSGLNSLIY